MIDAALAIGTDYETADISADAAGLRAMAALVRGLRPGEVVAVRCNDLPAAGWPCRITWLDLALTAPDRLFARAEGDRLRIELGNQGVSALASTLDDVADGLEASPQDHQHLAFEGDDLWNGVAQGSLPLIISGPASWDAVEAVLEAGLRRLLDDDHAGHPGVAADLGRLLRERDDRLVYGSLVVLRALLRDDDPACQRAELAVLDELLHPEVVPWPYAESVLDRLLALLDAEPVPEHRTVITGILGRWSDHDVEEPAEPPS